ncbi:hypothetical protein GIB67_033974 [Kingdonia uniflora]|uniref:Cyclin-like domain-containing protein n=1 Tax=Kingdonia uniflora TaxID=39325 RepID=A0A7J7M5Y1_9MAGN|nr:hypothetical protein GIB67_033974 [Kingdonia uniflora]
MDFLLCDENWSREDHHDENWSREDHHDEDWVSEEGHREECANVLRDCLEKEGSYMPKPRFGFRVGSSDLLFMRIKAVHWFIKCRSRLNLDIQTVFDAVNYLDRYVSRNEIKGMKGKTIELVSIACLNISAKFTEVDIPKLHELQLEDLDYTFESRDIKRMELEVLKALGWRLRCVTPCSYVELLIRHLETLKPNLHCTLECFRLKDTDQEILNFTEPKFIDFRPCVVAVSALRFGLEEIIPSISNAHVSDIINLIPQDQMDDTDACFEIMEEQLEDLPHSLTCGYSYIPDSPVTVMPMQRRRGTYNCHANLSPVVMSGSNVSFSSNPKKRKRERDDTTNKCKKTFI